MITIEELKGDIVNYMKRLPPLGESLRLGQDAEEIMRLTKESSNPDFWNDTERAQVVQKRIAYLSKKAEQYQQLGEDLEDLEVLVVLAEEENDPEALEEAERGLEEWTNDFERLRLETLLNGEHDSMNALVTLHAGAGGTEAQDWTEMLSRMYMRWVEKHDFNFQVLDLVDGDEAGLKSLSFRVSGDNAYGYLRSEHGVHRLVRISPFDSSGRRHTSFASCEVLPEFDETIEINIDPDDLKVDTYRASGAGGQHVNKTSSAVRITHLPTGIVVTCQNERSQIQNRATAMSILTSKLYQIAQERQLERIDDLKGDVVDNAWGSQIRSYVFCPYTMVRDHRTDFETSDVEGVMDGDIDGFINAWLMIDAQRRETADEQALQRN